MTVRLRTRLAVVLAVLAGGASGCSFVQRALALAGSSTVVAQWVEVVSDSVDAPTKSAQPVFLARAIIDAPPATSTCPTISINGGAGIQMHARETNVDPVHFPVSVCEAPVPSNATSVAIAGGAAFSFFPIDVQRLANRIYVVGDTGCRDQGEYHCTPPAQGKYEAASWAFPGLAADIASHGSPSLLVHVGDYLYRGCGSGKPCDTWENWNADFFVPAATLLRKAPWIFTRGNHELCSSAPRVSGGTGWFLFLDPHSACLSSAAAPACAGGPSPADCTNEGAQYPAPYAVDVGFDAGAQQGMLRMIVLDATKAEDREKTKTYDPQFRSMQSLAAGATQAWVLSHKPLWGIGDPEDAQGRLHTQSQALQQSEKDYPLPGNVQLFLSGHIHAFEQVTVDVPAQEVPAQLVAGGGGANLLSSVGPTRPLHAQIQPGDVFAGSSIRGQITAAHGYAVLTPESRSGSGFAWQGTYQDRHDDILFHFVIAAPVGRSP